MFHITDPEGVLFILVGITFLLASIFVAHWLESRESDREENLQS